MTESEKQCSTCIHVNSETEYGQEEFFCTKGYWTLQPELDGSNNNCADHQENKRS